MIEFRNLSYTFPNTHDPALRQINLRLPEGSFTLVVGTSGSGKSTLLRCIAGFVPHFSGGQLAGGIHVHDRDPVAEGPAAMSSLVGMVFQDPETQSVMERVEDELAFSLEQAGVPRAEMRVRVEEVLDLLDLAALRDRTLATLSGGERQRVAIGAVLALRPRILVLDEPTSQLDPQSAEDVLRALVRLNEDLGLTIVLAEHRIERVLPFADLLVYLDRTQPGLKVGPPAELAPAIPLRAPLITIAAALDWKPTPLTIKAGLAFSRSMPRPASVPIPPEPVLTPTLISLQAIQAGYTTTPTLRDLRFDLHAGEIVALLGRSGSGKSTLLKTIVGLVPIQRGRIQIEGRDTAGRSVAEICRRVAYLPQDPNALLFAETVREELETTLRNHGLLQQPTAATRITALLTQLGIAAHAERYPRDLSVGERQRVALGAILITKPVALLLDEPTRGLDYHAKQELASLLGSLRDAGIATLIVTHDVEFAAIVASRVVVLARGELIADGPIGQILGASPLFAPQTARLFPGMHWLTAEQALHGLAAQHNQTK